MILVYGKGKTGNSLSDFMKKNSIPFIIRDDTDFKLKDLEKVNLIVVSPGIPFYHDIFKIARKKEIPIIGDVEYAYRLFKGKIIAVTGTDGKSTTTHILGEFFKEKDPFIGGNYGEPFINAVAQSKKLAILELSSFQIYSTQTFRPNSAVVLNVSEDHLDWHKKKHHYFLSKIKILKNLKKENKAVLNYDQPLLRNLETKAKKYYFSMNMLPSGVEGIFRCRNSLILKFNKKIEKIDISQFKLKGNHNIQNLMAAVLTAYVNGIPLKKIESKIPHIKSLPYRLEFVKDINGIEFYNDSKATTVQAVKKAVESFPGKNIHLILGGIYKGGDFSVLKECKNIKSIFIFGRDRYTLKQMIGSKGVICRDIEEAVKKALRKAEKKDIVLFSPGCSSFDMFKNYIDRGNRFNEILENLNK